MDKNDIINYVMHTPHNTNKAVLSGMLNQLTEGGGSGSSDFSTATVKINYLLGDSPLTVAWEATEYIQSPNSDFTTAVVAFRYGVDAGQPVSELGTPTEMVVPIYRDYPTDIGNVLVYVTEYEESAQLNEFGTKTVVSGDAEITEDGYKILVRGDCEISLGESGN